MSNSTKVTQILKGTAWVSIYTGLYRLMTLLVSIMSARLLDVTDYGKVSILQSTAALFIMFATMGLGTVATKLVAEASERYVFGISLINLVLCIVTSIIIYLCADWISADVYQDSSLSSLLKLLSLYIFFSGITQIQSGILAGKEYYSKIAQVNLVFGVLSIVVIYFLIKHYAVLGWLTGLILLEVCKVIVLQWYIHRSFPNVMQGFSQADLLFVTKLSLPIALSGFFILPVNWYLTKELLLSSGYMDVALLNISDQWIAILTFFPIAVGNAMLPIMSKMQKGQERKNISDLALKINVIVSVFVAVPVLFAGEFILGLYGHSYLGHSSIFLYLLPLVIVLSLTNQLNNRVIAEGRPSLMMYSNLIWLLVSLPVSIVLLASKLGVVAILIGRLVAYLAKLIFLHSVSRRSFAT